MKIFFLHYIGMLRNGVCMDEICLEKNANLYWIYKYNLLPEFSSDLDQFFAYQWLNVQPIPWISFSLERINHDFYAFVQYYCLSLLLREILMWLVRALLYDGYHIKSSFRGAKRRRIHWLQISPNPYLSREDEDVSLTKEGDRLRWRIFKYKIIKKSPVLQTAPFKKGHISLQSFYSSLY